MKSLASIERAPLNHPMAMVCDDCEHVSSVEFVSFSETADWYWQCKSCMEYNTYDVEHEYANV